MSVMTIKKEWDAIIEKKLKGDTTLNDLAKVYPSTITMPPNVTADDVEETNIISKTKGRWANMAHIAAPSSFEKNRLALQALADGANGLSFHFDNNDDLDTILADIATEYITTRIITDEALAAKLKEAIEIGKYQNIEISTRSITLSAGGDASEIYDALLYLQSSPRADIIVNQGKDIIYEISRLRAIRTLTSELATTVIARYDVDGQNELGDYDLIERTYKVLSAVLGGADAVLTKYVGDENSRLGINIHHVLEHEAGLDQVIDPARGAYYIEKLTAEIINKVENYKK